MGHGSNGWLFHRTQNQNQYLMLRESRDKIHDDVVKGQFIKNSLQRHGQEVDQEISKRMARAGFRSDFWSKRNFELNENTLSYKHLPQHRFVDIRTRKSKAGVKRKKNHPIHNRVHYGHLNNLARELMYGFTVAIKEEIKEKLEKT